MGTSQELLEAINTNSPNLPSLEHLACPVCADVKLSFDADSQSLHCKQCNAEFPVYSCNGAVIPWFFPEPNVSLQEWKARLKGFLHINQIEQQQLKEGLKDKRLSKAGQKRISKLIEAKKLQSIQVLEILKPLGLSNQQDETVNDGIAAYQSKTPKVQGLDSYYNNIFRDWAWENGENEQMLSAIDDVLIDNQLTGSILTIGAGAGRLSYDLHQKYSAKYSLLLDINPLLLLAGCKVIQGERFGLNEFPVAPLNKNSFFKEQDCKAPVANNENIYFMFADGMNPPIKPNTFDVVVTPWLLDIIPQNLRDYIPRLNQCIKVGGTWLNTGSLAFFHKQQAWCYSEEEVLELIEKNGFEIIEYKRTSIQYMQSPLSAHGRTEEVLSFNAKKIKEVVVPHKYEYLPDWIQEPSKSIPKKFEYEIDSSKHLLQAQVLGAINGSRSIEQIGKLVAKQYNLGIEEATHAVRRILLDHFEET